MSEPRSLLSACLFYTSNRLARQMTKMADQIFKATGLPASYIYMLMTIDDFPEINQTSLSDKLSIAPSTSTRFAERLIQKGLVEKHHEWKEVRLHTTEKGHKLVLDLQAELQQLEATYSSLIGPEESQALAASLHQASENLKKKGY